MSFFLSHIIAIIPNITNNAILSYVIGSFVVSCVIIDLFFLGTFVVIVSFILLIF